MVYVELLLNGLKVIYAIGLNLLKLVIPDLVVKLLLVEYQKDQPWVPNCSNKLPFRCLLMIQICFIQVITYNILNLL